MSLRRRSIGAAWTVFMTGLIVGGEVDGLVSFLVAGALGAVLVISGFAAASRSRSPVPQSPDSRPTRLLVLSVVVGIGLGMANLLANVAIATVDPEIRASMLERFQTVRLLDAIVAAPLVEEVAIRLFLMSGIAWCVSLFTERARTVFSVALVGSALFFAALHLGRPMPSDPALAASYRALLLVKYTLAGLPLGWLFWRWGLPTALLAHIVANGTHLAFESLFF